MERLPKSWNHRMRLATSEEAHERTIHHGLHEESEWGELGGEVVHDFGPSGCSNCRDTPEHWKEDTIVYVATYDFNAAYGHIAHMVWYLCERHGRMFAKKWGVEIPERVEKGVWYW
jgi:hypothetical protein